MKNVVNCYYIGLKPGKLPHLHSEYNKTPILRIITKKCYLRVQVLIQYIIHYIILI